MTSNKVNSIKKVRLLLDSEPDIKTLSSCYHIVEKLLYHYKRVLNKAKEMEAFQLLTKIKLVMIEKISVA